MRYREEIKRYIEEHRQDMLNDIISLCEINSVKSAYRPGMPFGEGNYEVLQKAMEMAEEYGFNVKNYDNFVLAVDLNDKEQQLDILAHLDVVPAGEGWKETEPFKPVIKDGRIYGRGTSDDKGPVIAALYAMRAVKDLGIELSKNTRLILGTDEESNHDCIAYYYKQEKEAPMSFSPDGEYPVVNIEKGRLIAEFSAEFDKEEKLPRLVSISAGTKSNVVPPKAVAVLEGFEVAEVKEVADAVTKETGIRFSFDLSPVFEITALGENAHASLPADGNNAITGLLLLLSRLNFAPSKKIDVLRGLYELIPHGETDAKSLGLKQEDERSGALSLAFSILKVDDDELHGTFDLRSPVSSNSSEILRITRENFAKVGIKLLTESMTEPHDVDENSDFVKTLLRCYEEYTGLEGYCIALGGQTYVHKLKNGVAFGAVMPGTNTRMHGADEFAVIEELLVSAKIFAQSIVELCS